MKLRNPDKKCYMWKQTKALVQHWLDYWLISDDFQDDVDNTGIIFAIKTDHAAIVLQVNSVDKKPTGSSYWLALISEYEEGGLKMPHPESLIVAPMECFLVSLS